MKAIIILAIVVGTAGCTIRPQPVTTAPQLPFCFRSIQSLGPWEDADPTMVGRLATDVPTASLGKPYMTGGMPVDEDGHGYTTYGGPAFVYRVTFDLTTGKVVKFQKAHATYVGEANHQVDGTR
jgi:hypothetical protein